ncbi:MAG: hypothetical protein CVU38_14000 [Chloroflexi bacterium HGW-Chloroflexi-1]|nr:MAG: hypothetical protein CVU38_14000 [Chloroflexi bacterium HGW-Chloroflexi-1]
MNPISGRALVVEDDHSWQQILSEILADMGLAVDVVGSYEEAVAALRAAPHRVAVVDLSLTSRDHHNQDGLRVLDAIRRQDPDCTPVLLTGFATVELAVSAITGHAAYTCLRKEAFRRSEFRELIRRAAAAPPAPATPATTPAGVPRRADSEAPAANSPPETKSQVLIVEDDAGWRGILAELLAESGHRPWPCSSYGEALGLLLRERFALAVVDLSLASPGSPGDNLDGYRVLESSRSTGIPTIVVSGIASTAEVEHVYAEYEIFAYFEKQAFDSAAFRDTVAEALALGQALTGELATLTPRELEVLRMTAQGLTNKEIAAALVITINTVKRHLKSIFGKLDVNTRAAAAAIASSRGVS